MIIGMDEVGTGSWAGPVMVGAVATPFQRPCFWDEINDSKQVNSADRDWLFEMIKEHGVPWAVGHVTAAEVDLLGLGRAKLIAAQRALCAIHGDWPGEPLQSARIVVDGNNTWGLGDRRDSANDPAWTGRLKAVIKADEFVKEVGAASICAKSTRDAFMRWVASMPEFSAYGFENHVGYGTPFHRENLERYGPCSIHRRSVKPVRAWLAEHDPDGLVVKAWRSGRLA